MTFRGVPFSSVQAILLSFSVIASTHAFTVSSDALEVLNPEATCRVSIRLSPIKNGSYEAGLCSGTLISSNLILTAGHCLDQFKNAFDTPITVQCPKEHYSLYGVRIAFPLEWTNSGDNAANDFAFIQLNRAVTNTLPMKVAIASSTVTEAMKYPCYLSGYGPSQNSPAGSQHTGPVKDLKYSTMASKTQKGAVLQTQNKYTWIHKGDSGGSLFCQKENERPTLIGVISMVQTSGFRFLAWGWKKEVAIFAPTTNLNWALNNLKLIFN